MNTPVDFEPCQARETPSSAGRESFRADTCLTLYLRDIGPVKRLTRQEEVELAARMKRGDGEAREQMIKSNLRLVINIARAYQGIGLPLLDLISEGNIGLMRAVDRFDPCKGAKLSSYSAFWIRQAITQALASQSKALRLPTHVAEKLGKMRRAASRLEERLGREPTDDELAAELGTTSRRLNQMRMAAVRPASLDASIEGDEIGSYADTIADDKVESAHENMDVKARTVMVQQVVGTLDEREQLIVRLRFGLDGDHPMTLDQIAEELGISSERVRQLQKAALKKVRCRINHLQYGSLSPARLTSRKQPNRNYEPEEILGTTQGTAPGSNRHPLGQANRAGALSPAHGPRIAGHSGEYDSVAYRAGQGHALNVRRALETAASG